MKNIFEILLQKLDIPYTPVYANKMYSTHPFRDTIWGISKLLESYGARTQAVRIAEKKNLENIPVPFLAEIKNNSILVVDVSSKTVTYNLNGKEQFVDSAAFKEMWTGACLLLKKTESSKEPNYEKHLRAKRWYSLERTTMMVCAISLFVACMWKHGRYTICDLSAIFLNGAALYVCYLLIQKMLHKENKLTDKLCNMFNYNGCNSLLELDTAKLAGIYSLSECGFSFFAGNLLELSLFPNIARIGLPLVFLCALPFTIWSVWFQGWRAKKWCPLCLLVQSIVWMQFIVFLIWGYYEKSHSWNEENYILILLLPVCYILFLLVTHKMVGLAEETKQLVPLQYALNHIKYNTSVYSRLLQDSPQFDAGENISLLHFGHRSGNKPLVTVMSNLYCTPCAKMHKRLQILLDNGFEIQYVLTSFSEKLRNVNCCLIAYYMKYGEEQAWKLLNSWYAVGKQKETDFFNGLDIREKTEEAAVAAEMQRHDAWVARSGLTSTPTILLDGYKLPGDYSVEDIVKLYN